MRHDKTIDANSGRFAPFRDRADRAGWTGQHNTFGAVRCRDRQTAIANFGDHSGVGFGDGECDHRAARRQRLHQVRTRRDELHHRLQRQHASDAGRDILAQRVTGERGRLNTPVTQRARECVLQREQRGLRPPRFIEQRFRDTVTPEHHVEQLAIAQGIYHRGTSIHRGAEHGQRVVQIAAHPDPLRALSREQPRESRMPTGIDMPNARGRGIAIEKAGQLRCGIRAVGRHHRKAFRQPRASSGKAVADIGEILFASQQPVAHICHQRTQCSRRARRHQQQMHRSLNHRRRWRAQRCFTDDDMRIGAAETKAADAGDARPLASRPRRGLGHHLELSIAPVDARVRRREVKLLRQQSCAQRQHHLDQPRDTRRRFGVPDVRLHRAEQERSISGSVGTECGGERFHLDRIAEGRACAMRLDVVDARRCDARHLERATNHFLLRRSIRHREAAAASIRVHRRAADDRQNRVTIGLGVAQAPQRDHAAPLAAHEPIGVNVEGLAATIDRQHAPLREQDRRNW